MNEQQFQLVRTGVFALALLLALFLQRLRPHSNARGSLRVNASLWVANVGVMGVICGACACTVARWAAGAGVGVLNVASVSPGLGIPITVLSLDFVSYLWHRANHVVPMLWRLHQVHHSDLTFTASTALRFHPGELVLSLPLRLLAVAALGASPVAVVTFEALFTVANFFEHGDIDLPLKLEAAIDRVLVTPALHRFHHTRAGLDRDHNFGTILTVWDRVLGTYRQSSSAVQVAVGIPDVREPLAFRAALALPLRELEKRPS